MGLFGWAKRLQQKGEAKRAPAGAVAPADAARPAADPVKRGIARLDAGDFSGAGEAFREALALQPQVASNHVNLAYALLQTGALAEAAERLRAAVVLDPQSFDAHYLLGGALERVPDLKGAAEHLQRATSLRPDFEPAHADLCRVLALAGDTAAARAALSVALALNANSADFHHYLGNVCMTEADPAGAVESYARALALRPGDVQVHANMGMALHAQKCFDEAALSFERALAIAPSGGTLAKLGLTRKAQGRHADAAEVLERAVKAEPDNAEALNTLGMVLQEQGLLDKAIASYRRAVALRPELPGGYANLGLALYEKGDVAQAVVTYRQGLAIKSTAEAHDNLAIALQKQGAVDEAIEHYKQALAINPANLNTQSNLASALADGGSRQQAISAYRGVLERDPNLPVVHSNLLFHLSVDETCSPEDYLAEARRFDRKLKTSEPDGPAAFLPAEGRRLRVGFVSGDLRVHPVGYFIEGILKHLDRDRFELFAYPTIAKEDELTLRLKREFSCWRLLKGLDDEAAARAIRSDRIDVLLDLAGHTGDNRLPVFALRPAPVQVSWLGYFASTGVSAMDYLLADDVCAPPGSDHFFTERLWRLPQTRLCFTPPVAGSTPDVAPLPALERGYVTFGSFQHLAKVNDAVLSLWGRVFAALPNARLLIQSHQTGRPVYVDQILARLAKVGIAADRVTVRAPAHRSVYLASYGEVDLVLDTFPFTGGTTTCEALWMGVPTLTLTGDTMIARQGVAMLSAAGLSDWVADSPDDYVRKALRFATDLEALASLRRSLRERVQATPLFDVALFARRFEMALRGMWQERMSGHSADKKADTFVSTTQSVASSR